MSLANAWRLLRTVERLLQSEVENARAFAEIGKSLTDLQHRVARLESREDLLRLKHALRRGPGLPTPCRV